jgi:hypothetical protein
MKQFFLFEVVLFLVLFAVCDGRLAGECAQLCNDLRTEVLTLAMCREAKRTLPRPKVGDFCSTAMEQGFSDACVAICMDERPVNRVAQTCRAAAIEMPRPTVRRWCEHGYNVAFQKTVEDLSAYFGPKDIIPVPDFPKDVAPVEAAHSGIPREEQPNVYRDSMGDSRAVLATIPITLDDNSTKDLIVHEGQNAEEAVVEFCRDNVPNDVSTCIRQLLTVVIEKLDELSINA